MSDAGAGSKSVRNCFVSSTAALPGWWGESSAHRWELQQSPASFLAELRWCCLGERHEEEQAKRGFMAGWLFNGSSGPVFLHPVLAWFLPCSSSWIRVSQHLLVFWIHIFNITTLLLVFQLWGVVDHKMVTPCCNASWWFPPLQMLNLIRQQLLSDCDATWLVFAAGGNLLEPCKPGWFKLMLMIKC